MRGVSGDPALGIVGGDPTETELSPHRWPLVEVVHKTIDPLGNGVPLQPRCVAFSSGGSRRGDRSRRATGLVYGLHRPNELFDRRTRPIRVRDLEMAVR